MIADGLTFTEARATAADYRCGDCGAGLLTPHTGGGKFGVRCLKDFTHSAKTIRTRTRILTDGRTYDIDTQKPVDGYERRTDTMTLAKVTAPPPAPIQQAILKSAWGLTKQEATYTITFRNRGGPPSKITAVSAVAARVLYQQSAARGFAYPFQLIRADDKIVGNVWICDSTWEATDPESGQKWTFMTRGAEPYNPQTDQLAVANRKAFGKAERNACLRCIPRPIWLAFLAYVSQETGIRVVDVDDPVEILDAEAAALGNGPEQPEEDAPTDGQRPGWYDSLMDIIAEEGKKPEAVFKAALNMSLSEWRGKGNSDGEACRRIANILKRPDVAQLAG